MKIRATCCRPFQARVQRLFAGVSVVLLLLGFQLSGAKAALPGVVELSVTAQGWSSALGFTNDFPGTTFAGRYIGSTNLYRDWYVFDVPQFTSRLVRVEFVVNAGLVSLPINCRPFRVRAVTNSPSAVMANPSAPNIYADLGDGTLWGQTYFCFYDQFVERAIPLADGIVPEISAAQNGQFVIGASLEELHPGWDEPEYVGYGSMAARMILRFATPPVVTAPPTAFDALFSFSAQLDVAVYSAESFAVQWRRDGAPVPGATNTTLFFPSFVPAQVGDYDVVVSNASGSVTSIVASASGHPFQFMSFATNLNVPAGEPIWEWRGLAGQGPVVFQWRKNGVDISGMTTSVLSIPNAAVTDSGHYDLVASNVFGVATSAVVVITVFEQAPVFIEQPGGQTNVVGGSAYLVSYADAAPRAAYQWFHDGTLILGANAYFLSLPALQSSDAGNYFVVASNSVGMATSLVATVEVIVQPPVLYGGPASATLLPGESHLLRSFVYGSEPLALQWWHNGQPVPDATNTTLALDSFSAAQAGEYFLTASNEAAVASGRVALVSLAPGGPLDFWERVRAPDSNHLYAVATGNGWCVAVGGAGTIVSSRDGASFSALPNPSSNRLRAVTFDGTNFLATGNGGVLLQFSGETNSPVTLQTLSQHPVTIDLFEAGEGDWRPSHLQLADTADLLLISPATANCLAKLAHGIADDALSTIALALRPKAKVLVAPAMNGKMWLHPATQANVTTLQARGVEFIGPDKGLLACGYEGIGRLWDVDQIVAKAQQLLK